MVGNRGEKAKVESGVSAKVAALDGITLDQVRTFLAVVDLGSFSAAGRRLGRVQSAVSHSIAAFEAQLGVEMFDRSARLPRLTAEGQALLASARSVSLAVEGFHSRARQLRSGTEAVVSLVADALFPTTRLVAFAEAFQERWPGVELRLRVEALGAVIEEVRSGRAGLAIAVAYDEHRGVVAVPAGEVEMATVVGATHPLALIEGEISTERLAEHVQIVLSGRGVEQDAPDRGVLSPRTWRVADMESRQAMIRAGLGWGNLPLDRAQCQLDSGALVRIWPAAWGRSPRRIGLVTIWLPQTPPGPAGRWLVEALGAGKEE